MTFEAVQGQPDILFGERVPKPVFTMARPKNDDGNFPPDLGNGGGSEPDPVPTTPGSSAGTGVERLVPTNLMIFKALVTGDSLTVRGYLRLDYGGANPDVHAGIAFPFGEFQFYGCRRIVTISHIRQMVNKNFALAPKGTRFDGMWFTQAGTGLTLLDGTFPSWPKYVTPTIIEINEPGPLPADASSTVVNKIDLPVLEGTASRFRLLAPHQDLQFVGDRPFFSMDGDRIFIVSSTGSSGFRSNPADWMVGDLATIGMTTEVLSETDNTISVSPDSQKTFAVLLPGPEGRRIAREPTLIAEGATNDLIIAVDVWRTNPFNPHAVARLRTRAYQKMVMMKYIDNLIAWGDQLFRQNVLESTNEATQLYVLAAEILGRRQEILQRDVKPPVETFNTIASRLGALSNALEQIELLLPAPDSGGSPQPPSGQPDPPSSGILYFCVPENDRLVRNWETAAGRLFNIRHCMNIEGQVIELPPFAPPRVVLFRYSTIRGLSPDPAVSLTPNSFRAIFSQGHSVIPSVDAAGSGMQTSYSGSQIFAPDPTDLAVPGFDLNPAIFGNFQDNIFTTERGQIMSPKDKIRSIPRHSRIGRQFRVRESSKITIVRDIFC